MKQAAQDKMESRDALVIAVDSTARTCQVRIQNSTDLVTAYYPEGWQRIPFWLKKNAPVRINHRGGLRGRIELVSLGQVIITPLSGATFVTPDIPVDGILDGCQVSQVSNEPQMAVMIKPGSIRMGGSTYVLGEIKMESDVYRMGMGGKMGDVAGISTISAAPADGYRQDLIVFGEDSVIDVVTGTTFSTAEVLPGVPSSHVELSNVLIHGSMSKILNQDIGKTFSSPEPARVSVAISASQISSVESTVSVSVAILDQYGNAILRDSGGWYITLEFSGGNGILNSGADGDSTSQVGAYTGSGSNQVSFGYTMDTSTTPSSPAIMATLHSDFSLSETGSLLLLNSSGEILP
jgi:hypothetical protein